VGIIAALISILRNFVTVLDELVHSTFEFPKLRRSLSEGRSFIHQLACTLKLKFSDFEGVRILRCQNLVGTGLIYRRPILVNVGEF
jgi:hypothetical protein